MGHNARVVNLKLDGGSCRRPLKLQNNFAECFAVHLNCLSHKLFSSSTCTAASRCRNVEQNGAIDEQTHITIGCDSEGHGGRGRTPDVATPLHLRIAGAGGERGREVIIRA